MKAYAEDLRKNVFDELDKNGGTKVAACETFGIGKDTLFQWLTLRKETGGVKATVREDKPRKVNFIFYKMAASNLSYGGQLALEKMKARVEELLTGMRTPGVAE